MSTLVVELLQKQFPEAVLETSSQHGDEAVVVQTASWKEIARFLKTAPQTDMSMLMDLTVVDYPERLPRFEVVAHFYSLNKGHRLRMKTRVGDAEGNSARVPTLADVWGSANWMEREAWDMFGVVFDGHPDLRRILLYPEFVGHPLRKDYPAQRIQPLVEYRSIPGIQKIAPFGEDEGMSFGRQTFDRPAGGDGPDPDVFPPEAS